MKKKLLLKLAALLDVVPDDKFDMHWWGFGDARMGTEPLCSSSACALGWATIIPECKRAGLQLVAAPGDAYAHIRLGDEINSNAAATLFGITYGQAIDLFESGRSTPKLKAAQIRRMVEIA